MNDLVCPECGNPHGNVYTLQARYGNCSSCGKCWELVKHVQTDEDWIRQVNATDNCTELCKLLLISPITSKHELWPIFLKRLSEVL